MTPNSVTWDSVSIKDRRRLSGAKANQIYKNPCLNNDIKEKKFIGQYWKLLGYQVITMRVDQ